MRLRVPFFFLTLTLAAVALATFNQPGPTAAGSSQSHAVYFPHVANDPCGPIFETFDGGATDWFIGQIGDLRAEIIGGEYRLHFTTPGAVWLMPGPVCPRSEYIAAVDAHWGGVTGNFIGLLFAIDDARQRAYLFAVNTDTREWMVFDVRPNDLRTVIAPTRDDAVRPGLEVNRLAAERTGERINLTINGQTVGGLDDAGPGAPVLAGVAAAAYTDQRLTDARFDNFAWRGR